MEIKGNIGDEVYVKARIRSINITEKGVKYDVLLPAIGYGSMDSDQIMFTEPKEEPKEEPDDSQTVSKKTLKTSDGRFQHSKWLRQSIEDSGLSQTKYTEKLNKWLEKKHEDGKYTDIKRYYASDISNYMNGNIYMSEYKLNTIKAFAKDELQTAVKVPKVETLEKKWTKATVESTMAKLRKMRGEE